MRTTIRLDDDLVARAKQYGLDRGKTFTSLVREALIAYLARGEAEPRTAPTPLPIGGCGGTLPGVDLDDGARLVDIMDGRD